MSAVAPRWRNGASLLALVAGVVSVVVLVIEGPPGSGYGWGSVVVSAVISAGLLLAMAWMVRSSSPGVAKGCALLAVVVVVLYAAWLAGNWGLESATFRILDTVAAVLALAASAAVLVIAVATARHRQ